ncbi:MAG: SEC-C metal-binding domain-containing protein [Bryobacteraceae bacterium]
MTDFGLDEQQLAAIDALTSGANLTEAAALAGVHLHTLAKWRRNSLNFQVALSHALHIRALQLREKAMALADRSFQTLGDILEDPKASPSVRLKAAIFIIQTAIAPPPYKPEKPLTLFDQAVDKCLGKKEHKEDSQPASPINEQDRQPYRRPGLKTGRNEACPCGSGQKYKYCCLGKLQNAA